mmetsp:Transcript_14856/g.21260  ORF Transcript_14856/g.21260 Transcript_14856/m.21260 type:complete len:161 (-) Transcript_14856:630-1112(-)
MTLPLTLPPTFSSSNTTKSLFTKLTNSDDYPKWKNACAIQVFLPKSPYDRLTIFDTNGYVTFNTDFYPVKRTELYSINTMVLYKIIYNSLIVRNNKLSKKPDGSLLWQIMDKQLLSVQQDNYTLSISTLINIEKSKGMSKCQTNPISLDSTKKLPNLNAW